jgi:hypothetical protein
VDKNEQQNKIAQELFEKLSDKYMCEYDGK